MNVETEVVYVVVLVAFCSLLTIVFFTIMKNTMGMRSDEEAEIAGLDMPEMGALAYPDFLEAQGSVFYSTGHNGFAELEPSDARSTREEVGAS